MSVFVDTSALYAVLDADDQNHERAKRTWVDLITREIELVCTDYVLVETFAVVRHRLGMEAVRALQGDVVPVLRVEWVDKGAYHAGITALLIAARRQLSLVDCVSFDTMRRLGVKTAFTFDQHFVEQGFDRIP